MDATSGNRMSADGELRYRIRCIDKLGHTFRGDETLLDAGCGNGGVARLLRQRVHEVVAVDVEASAAWQQEPGLTFTLADVPALEVQRRLASEHINVSLMEAASAQLDFGPRGLDQVVRSSVHYYNSDAEIDVLVDAVKRARTSRA